MDGKKEEYTGSHLGDQGFASAPYFASFLQGISVSTSASNGHPSEGNYQGWSAPFADTYSTYSDWPMYPNPNIYPESSTLGTGINRIDETINASSAFPNYYTPRGQSDSGLGNSERSSLGSPFSSFGRLDSPDFHRSSSPGHEFCADAVSQLQSYAGKTYDHFGTVPVFQTEGEETDATDNSSPSVRSSSPVSLKPSYSDVAKNKPKVSSPTLPSGSTSSRVKDAKSITDFSTAPTYLKVPYKKTKSNRVHLKGRNSAEGTPVVKPDSKYGLDSFEDPGKLLKERTKRQHSHSGSDSMPPSRKGSTSSLGSASSGLEEFSLRATDLKTSPMLDKKLHGVDEVLTSDKTEFASEPECKRRDKKQVHKSNSKDEKAFFNPKLIFQPRPANKPQKVPESIPNNQSGLKSGAELLNNDKPKSNLYNSNFDKSSSTNYINNDLGQGKKQTNMDSQRGVQDRTKDSNVGGREPSPADAPERASAKRKVENSQSRKSEVKSSAVPLKKSKKNKDEPNPVGEFLKRAFEWSKWALAELAHILHNVALLVFKCALLLCLLLGQHGLDLMRSLWNSAKSRIPYFRGQSESDWSNTSAQSRLKSQGLDDNIILPTTGEEAMKRLLACKGKDPFSILGVRSDATDEQIKRYYRKQAVLVHPDKNQQPGAEEAFKILGHAFELIGEPEKRQKYREARETEAAMQEFADLLTKLHDKMQEAANTMHCDKCGGKHTRVVTDRPFYSARFCDRCNTRHAAKEGDVWAESSVLGFLWHYYACMEGKIYDITEWASCQNTHFKHIQANAHQVIYRIATNANKRHNSQRTNEADLEDFFNQLFQQSRKGEGDQQAAGDGYGYGAGAGSQQPGSWTSSSASRQNKKRKKKRH